MHGSRDHHQDACAQTLMAWTYQGHHEAFMDQTADFDGLDQVAAGRFEFDGDVRHVVQADGSYSSDPVGDDRKGVKIAARDRRADQNHGLFAVSAVIFDRYRGPCRPGSQTAAQQGHKYGDCFQLALPAARPGSPIDLEHLRKLSPRPDWVHPVTVPPPQRRRCHRCGVRRAEPIVPIINSDDDRLRKWGVRPIL